MLKKLIAYIRSFVSYKDRHPTWLHKPEVCTKDVLYLHPAALILLAYVISWCERHGVQPVVTSIYRPPNDGISKSTTHQDFRAFDLSLKPYLGWNQNLVTKLARDVFDNFKDVGAISSRTGVERPVHIHGEGENYHAHFQVRPNAKIQVQLQWR